MAHRQNSIHDWFSERKINTAAQEPQLCLVNTQRATESRPPFGNRARQNQRQVDDAVNADARGDYAKALRLIHPAANDGDAAAQFYLGTMYVTATACNRTIRPQHYGFEKQRSKATSSPKLISGSYIAMAAA